VSEEHFLLKASRRESGVFSRGDDFRREAGEVAPAALGFGVEDEGDERGLGFDDGEVELAGDFVSEAGGADFGDGESTGGDDEDGGSEFGTGGLLSGDEMEAGVLGDGADGGSEEDLDVGGGALGEEHVEDELGGVVTEELAEFFLVPWDAVVLDEVEEVGGGVAGERGFGEVGVLGEEIFRAAVEVGEVAASSAGDEDFFAGSVGVVEDGDAASSAAGFHGAHESGSACAEDKDVKVMGGGGAHCFECIGFRERNAWTGCCRRKLARRKAPGHPKKSATRAQAGKKWRSHGTET
jgi:hypothetical protein